MQKQTSQDQSVFGLLDWILHYTLFHGFDTLGSHLREKGSLDYDGGLFRLQVQMNFDTTINYQHTYTNVFYISLFAGLISHISKPTTGSHLEPGLLRQRLWLRLPLSFGPLFANTISHHGLRNVLQNSQLKRASWSLKLYSFLNSPNSSRPETNGRPVIRCQFGNYFIQYQKVSESCRNSRTPSWTILLPWNGAMTLRYFHEYIHEFDSFDVCWVNGFCPIPKQGALRMTIQGHRIHAEVDQERRNLLWVLILEGLKLEIRTLASTTNSLLAVTGLFWPKALHRIRTWGSSKGPTVVTTADYP
jgi:hypothetical protein